MDAPRIIVSEFNGLVTNASANAIPPGAAQDQFNCHSLQRGQLDVRAGMRLATCANAITATSNNILAMYQVPIGSGHAILYEDSAGNVKFANQPSIA